MWTKRLPAEPTPDDDTATLRRIAEEIRRQHDLQNAEHNETTPLAPIAETRAGVEALLSDRHGSSGDADTMKGLGLSSEYGLERYRNLFSEATKGIPEGELKALHARVSGAQEKGNR